MPSDARFDTLALVAPVSIVGAMLGSLYVPPGAGQNAFVIGGLVAGALVGWRAYRATSAGALFGWSLLIGAACGVPALVPLALRARELVLLVSGASLGAFMSIPMYLLTLPAFYARRRAARAREGSIVGRASAHANWAASGASVALLGLMGQPVVLLDDRRIELSLAVLAASVLAGLLVVVSDVRGLRKLVAYVLPAEDSTVAGAQSTPDVGLGDERIEQREPPKDPFRSIERVVVITVGSLQAGKRALALALALDAASLLLCVGVLAYRVRRL